ncbi:MAG: ATP-binding cassette domain-containing protein [Lentisphaeria bacterium]|nr:ATP-binding cassette domain-containing protein [Candidatus Neomarinimicrobiota bacterium]MCF7842176.1 ATP-binding cassette domain-containing protein [Lentisphaeria bacterium]
MQFPAQHIPFIKSGFMLRTAEVNLDPTAGIAMVGQNGSGKSTWAKAVAGVLKTGNRTAEKWLYVPQSMEQFFFAETLAEQLGYLFPDGYDRERLGDLFAQFRLDSSKLASYPLRWLSGGERRRAALACALYLEASYLILDEPTIGLGPNEALVMLDLLNTLQARLAGLVVITHALDVINGRRFVLGFEAGGIVYQGVSEEFSKSRNLIQKFGVRTIRQPI